MKRRCWLLVTIVASTFQNAGLGQPPSKQSAVPVTVHEQARIDRDRLGQEINEDIEIMRRILSGRLTGQGQFAGATNSPQGSWLRYSNYLAGRQNPPAVNPEDFAYYDVNSYPTARSTIGQVEGVYLDGKGVVFTMSMPTMPNDPLLSPTPKPAKTISDWERARQVLRGEHPEPESKTEALQPTIADIILAVLAENGKNLRLKENEDVAVVVTFRNPQPGQNSLLNSYQQRFINSALTTTAPDQSRLATLYGAQTADPAGHGKTARDFLLLGDLHLHQQQYAQAQENFQKALTLDPKGDSKQLAETFRKLAETKLHLGQLDEAKAMIESAVAWEKKSKEPAADKPKTDPATSPVPRWPTKLIVTVGKRQLDDIAAGKMSSDQFRNAIKIELVAPSTVK